MSVGWLRACALVMLGLFSVTALAKDKTAIVIGGGLSGLTAAYELQNKGWQVTLLERHAASGTPAVLREVVPRLPGGEGSGFHSLKTRSLALKGHIATQKNLLQK